MKCAKSFQMKLLIYVGKRYGFQWSNIFLEQTIAGILNFLILLGKFMFCFTVFKSCQHALNFQQSSEQLKLNSSI